MKGWPGRGSDGAMLSRDRSALAWISSLWLVSLQGCGGRVIYADEDGSRVDQQLDADEQERLTDGQPGDTEAVEPGADDDQPLEPDEDGRPTDEQQDEAQLDCSGSFDDPSLLFEDVGWSPQALSPTRDGLEFFYARLALSLAVDASGERKITVRRRAHVDDVFLDPEPVVELDGVCAQVQPGTEIAGLDVSRDALRLYIACNTFAKGDYGLSSLVVARRADRQSPFAVDPRPIGQVGYSIAITRDELTLFATSSDIAVDYVLMHTRSSVDEPFGELRPVPGWPTIRNPEPVPGGLRLLGVDSSTGTRSHLVSVQRNSEDGDFSAPSTEGLPTPPEYMGDYSPALAGDCKSLYFTRYDFTNNRPVVMQALRYEPLIR